MKLVSITHQKSHTYARYKHKPILFKMKYSLSTCLAVLGMASAHSWVECTDHDNKDLLQQMIAGSQKTPAEMVDPV